MDDIMIDLTTNDEDVIINNDDNYTRPKIPLRRKQSHNHRVIDLTVTTCYWRDILLFDDGFGGLAFERNSCFINTRL